MNNEQLDMIARGLKDARPMCTVDNPSMTQRDRDALIVWSQCCIHVAANIARAHPRFNQQEFINERCEVPAAFRSK